jgi:hypothetical protein
MTAARASVYWIIGPTAPLLANTIGPDTVGMNGTVADDSVLSGRS